MARTIMIVGNGDIEAGLAHAIDAADIVMRFNDCRSVGNGGRKTDIIAVCNTGRPGRKMAGGGEWKANPAVQAASSIWCIRDPAKFAAMRADIVAAHPDLDDFCDDYTGGFRDFAQETGKAFHIIPSATHERLDDELAAFHPAPYVVPSTGLVAIAEFLEHFCEPGDHIALAGFSHQGWEWHPWEAERRWIEERLQRGKLQRSGISDKYGSIRKVGNS
jgi:hypothetical protein